MKVPGEQQMMVPRNRWLSVVFDRLPGKKWDLRPRVGYKGAYWCLFGPREFSSGGGWTLMVQMADLPPANWELIENKVWYPADHVEVLQGQVWFLATEGPIDELAARGNFHLICGHWAECVVATARVLSGSHPPERAES